MFFTRTGSTGLFLRIAAFILASVMIFLIPGCKATGSGDDTLTDAVTSDIPDVGTPTGGEFGEIYIVPEEISLTGQGTKDNPFLISTPAQLCNLAAKVNSGEDTSGKYYALSSDIDLGGAEFIPIGDTSTSTKTAFRGVFDGYGYTISNFKITISSSVSGGRFGLFAVIDGGEVKNLKITSSAVSIEAVTAYCGVIAGMVTNGGIISGCTVGDSVTLNGTASVGAIAGRCMNGAMITGCINYAAVRTDKAMSGTMLAGGITGVLGNSGAESEISYCMNFGSVTMEFPAGSTAINYGAGGIAGCIGSNGPAKITDCVNTGIVTGPRAGGITSRINWSGCTINKCYNIGAVTCDSGSASETGTLIGYTGSVGFTGSFTDSYAAVVSGYDVCGSSIAANVYALSFRSASAVEVESKAEPLIKQIIDRITITSFPDRTPVGADAVRLAGFQSKIGEDGNLTIRLISVFGLDMFDTAGFVVSIKSGDLKNTEEKSIYGEFLSEIGTKDGKTDAHSLKGLKIGAAQIKGLPVSGTVVVTVTPYGLKNNIKTSAAVTYTAIWYDSEYCTSVKGNEFINFERAYDCGYSCLMTVFNDANEGLFHAAADQLLSEKYEILSESSISGNFYMTAVGTTYSASLALTNYTLNGEEKSELRVMREPAGSTDASLFKKQEFKEVCDPLLLQVGAVSYGDSVTNGTCYIFRLSDGSFVIYDGGNYDDYVTVGGVKVYRQAAQRIYKLLKEYAPDPGNITIAAWLITHNHGDHTGALVRFAELYRNDKTIKIERFISNYTEAGAGSDKAMAAFASAKHIQVHPGQTINIRDAEIEILYTHELYSPQTISNLNTASIISRVTLGGQTILMSADMSPEANEVVCAVYGDYLASDIVAVAHHGWEGGSTEYYTLAKPVFALWPVGLNGFYGVNSAYVTKTNLSAEARNEYFVYDSTDIFHKNASGECVWVEYSAHHIAENRMRALYVAGFSTWVFNLPFGGTNFTVEENTYIG